MKKIQREKKIIYLGWYFYYGPSSLYKACVFEGRVNTKDYPHRYLGIRLTRKI